MRAKLSDQEWQVFLELGERLGIPVRELLGKKARFTEIELAAHRFGRAVAQMTTERLAGERAERAVERQNCPKCGEACPVTPQERELMTLDGPVELREAVAHCSACRRDFFPSAGRVGSQSTEV